VAQLQPVNKQPPSIEASSQQLHSLELQSSPVSRRQPSTVESVSQQLHPTDQQPSSSSSQLQPANQQLRTTEAPFQQLQPPDLQQPAVTTVLQLPAPVRQTGRPLKRKMTLLQKRLQPFERMTTLDKDVMRLSWIVDEETAAEVIHNGKIVEIDDIRGDVNITVSEEHASIGDTASYFSSPAWEVVSLIVKDLQEVDWPCSHCQCVSSASENWVQCDLFLQWSHYRCVGLRTKPRSKLWFCDRCN